MEPNSKKGIDYYDTIHDQKLKSLRYTRSITLRDKFQCEICPITQKSWCNTGAKHWHQTVSIWHFKFQFNVLGSIFNNFLKYFERRFILLIVINFLKKIHQAIWSTTHHSLPSFPLHFACLLVDLSWNINYVDK